MKLCLKGLIEPTAPDDVTEIDENQSLELKLTAVNTQERNANASDFFRLVGKVTHGANNGGSFSEMMGTSISN